MAEEVKKEEKKVDGKKIASTIFKVVLGLAFLGLAVYLMVQWGWWRETWKLVKGCAGPFLALAGIITLAIAKE
jgi:hypothetical protein